VGISCASFIRHLLTAAFPKHYYSGGFEFLTRDTETMEVPCRLLFTLMDRSKLSGVKTPLPVLDKVEARGAFFIIINRLFY
jgi:hypothetical protein